MTEFSPSAQDRLAVDIARLYVRLHMAHAAEMFPAWTVMAALSIELGHFCRQGIESKKRTPEDVRKLVTLIEKIAFNPTDENLQ